MSGLREPVTILPAFIFVFVNMRNRVYLPSVLVLFFLFFLNTVHRFPKTLFFYSNSSTLLESSYAKIGRQLFRLIVLYIVKTLSALAGLLEVSQT